MAGRAKAMWIVVLAVGLPCAATAQTDFEEYVGEIRKAGMSEGASGNLRSMASLLSGSSTLTATRTPEGDVLRSYRSNTCFMRTTDERVLEKQRALRESIQAKRDVWVEFLRTRADTDGSGFVSTEEGRSLERVVELGLIASQLMISNVGELAEALQAEEAEVAADIPAYSRLLAAAKEQGLEGMPELPAGLANALGGAESARP
jgi:hypothetical protein